MGTRTLYSGMVWVAYGQVYVQSGDESPTPDRAFGGQVNGLCGAAEPGALFLVTGLHTGRVKLTIAAYDDAPALGDIWEEIVEVSFTSSTHPIWLVEWGGGAGHGPTALGLGLGSWRARYCATGMDAESPGRRPDDEGSPEHLLQFWPSPPSSDRVIRQTGASAASWHDAARRRPPPPPPPTLEELAEAERLGHARARAARDRYEVQRHWGGHAPSDRLRQVGGNVLGLAGRDRALLDELDRADPNVQRAVAVWAARRACEMAEMDSTGWVATGLDALDRGEPLPAPFDNLTDMFTRLQGDTVGRTTTHLFVERSDSEQRVRPPIDPRYAALPAIPAAAHADPLRAAIDALAAASATSGDDDRLLFDEARHKFLFTR